MNVAVLASGQGTNLQALLDTVHGRDGVRIVAVASDQPGAPALDRAAGAQVPRGVFPREDFPDREARDRAMAGWLAEQGTDLVVLAGYMALLTPAFIGAYAGRIVNVHPSLLPAFPGLHAVQQALDHGVQLIGVTVHLVDEGMDTGPILLQEAVPLGEVTDADAALALLRPLEHRLLPEAVRLLARGAVTPDAGNPRRLHRA